MGLVVRFPLERARAIAPYASEEGASILVLPVVHIDRSAESEQLSEHDSKPRSRGGRSRRRTKRPA
jgi:hypothetical protein